MMRALLGVAFVSALLSAWPSFANTVRVRSGEHVGFTRVVFQFDVRPEWTAGRIDGGYGIRFQSVEPYDIDTSEAFRLISRRRLSEISAIENRSGLDLELGCECSATFVNYQENAIIIDISDGPPDTRHDHEAALVPTAEAPRTYSSLPGGVQPAITMQGADQQASLLDGWQDENIDRTRPVVVPSPEVSSEQLPVRAASPSDSIDEESIPLKTSPLVLEPAAPLVNLLSQELSRAVAQGLVEAETARSLPSDLSSDQPVSGNSGASRNLSIVTGMDRDTGQRRQSTTPSVTGQTCLTDAAVAVSEWGDISDRQELGRLRSELISEDGSATQSGLLNLARYYLFLGFGSEAALFAEKLENPTDTALLTAMADIIDRGRARALDLTGQLSCEGDIALWAAMAQPMNPSDVPRDFNVILQAFAALPLHLRSHLAPLLAERLQDIGAIDQARTVLSIATRIGTGSPEHDLSRARLGLEGTGAEDARISLETLSTGTDVTSARALQELLRDAEANGLSPDPSWVDDAPSLIRATRGTDTAANLNVAMLSSMVTLKRFDEVLIILQEDSPGVTQSVRESLARRALLLASKDADAPTFLRIEAGYKLLVGVEFLSEFERLTIANRLAELGLPHRAIAYLSSEYREPADRLSSARILEMAGRAEDAIALIQDATGQREEQLRARALEGTGRFSEAIPAYRTAGNFEKATELALRIGDWEWIAAEGEDEVASAVRQLVEVTSPKPGGHAKSNTDLLTNVGRSRESVARLLDELVPALQ